MYLAYDPYIEKIVILDDDWYWAFFDIDDTPTENEAILAHLVDHCASCGAIHEDPNQRIELPSNQLFLPEAGVSNLYRPGSYLELLPLTWHDESPQCLVSAVTPNLQHKG